MSERTTCASRMAGPTGFEPATSRVTGGRSKPLSYGPMLYRRASYQDADAEISRKENTDNGLH